MHFHGLYRTRLTPSLLESAVCFLSVRATLYMRSSMLRHSIQCAPVLEPLDLTLVECMSQLRLPRLTILWVHSQCHGPADGELRAHKVNFVVRIDLVVVRWINEGKREHPLLFEIGFMLSNVSAF